MPVMITPINDPMVSPVVSPAEYVVPPIPTESTAERVPLVAVSSVQEGMDSPVRECSPLLSPRLMIRLSVVFSECFTITFLYTHHSLLAKLGR